MGAMKEEIKPILDKFDNYKIIKYGGNIYYEIKYSKIKIIIVYSKIGKVFATLTTSILIEKFKCDIILFSGVAGALNPKLQIGDLIIATKVCQHDVDITSFGHKFGYIPESSVYIETNKDINDISKKVAKKMDITIKGGIIATGDQFVENEKKREFIKNTFFADALDMESSAVAVVCKNLNIPFFILRTISDTADMNANINFQKFLKKTTKISADFMFELLKELIIKNHIKQLK